MYKFFFFVFLIQFILTFKSGAEVRPSWNVEVTDLGGAVTMLDRLAGSKGMVVVARETNCPISEKYGARIKKLEDIYSERGLEFVYIYAGQIDIAANASTDKKKFSFKGAYLVDPELKVARHFQLQSTTEVLLLNSMGELVYRGALDDQHSLSGSKPEAKNNYLQEAIENLLKGQQPSRTSTPAPGCLPNLSPRKSTSQDLTFNRDIYPVLEKHCIRCHRESLSLVDLSTYESVHGRQRTIEHVLKKDLMPPWSVKPGLGPWINDLSLPPDDEKIILAWLSSGAKKGEGVVKKNIAWTETWSFGKPDLQFKIPRSVKIPADGTLPYQYFTIPTGLKKDAWVRSYEIRPLPKHVHHITFLVIKKGEKLTPAHFSQSSSTRFGWVLGSTPEIYPRNVGALIPRESQLGVQIHYTSNGTAATDNITSLGLRLHTTPPKAQRREVFISDENFRIPAHQATHNVPMRRTLDEDIIMSGLYVHMHYRGKSAMVNLIHPDGRKENILSVGAYRFDQQFSYDFQIPRLVTKGTVIECINTFDNSAGNPVNPDAAKDVSWGEQFTDEMSNCSLYGYK